MNFIRGLSFTKEAKLIIERIMVRRFDAMLGYWDSIGAGMPGIIETF